MRIPYKKVRQLSTAELPGVLCDPILTFEFVAAPSYALTQDVSMWLGNKDRDNDWAETRRLAAELIKTVIIPDGTRYELGTPQSIDELAKETDQAFISNLLHGWNTRISLERIAEVKKIRPSLAQSSINDGDKSRQLAS